jgi:hypothetical protein
MIKPGSTRAAALLLLVGASLFAVGLSSSNQRDPTPRPTGLLIDPPAITQVVDSSDPVTISFRLTNATRDIVQIGPVQTTCGCTVAEPIQTP